MAEKIAGIYKITSPTGKVYVGRSLDIYKRWREHSYPTKSLIYRSIQKHGYENHSFEILIMAIPDNELLNKLEILFISLYDSTNNEKGLNLCKGGGRLGFKHSESTINTMRKNRKGKQNSLGRVHSSETKDRISKSLTGKILSEDRVSKVKTSLIKNGKTKRLLDSVTGEVVDTMVDAVKKSGIARNTIVKYLGQPDFRYSLYVEN